MLPSANKYVCVIINNNIRGDLTDASAKSFTLAADIQLPADAWRYAVLAKEIMWIEHVDQDVDTRVYMCTYKYNIIYVGSDLLFLFRCSCLHCLLFLCKHSSAPLCNDLCTICPCILIDQRS